MEKIKTYSGTVSGANTAVNIPMAYGITNTVSTVLAKRDALNDILADFLAECGVDARFEDGYLWLNGLPINVYPVGTNNYIAVGIPYRTTAILSGSTSAGMIFNGMNYNFKLSFLGNPEGTFVVRISTNTSTPTFANGICFGACSLNDIMSGKRIFAFFGRLLSSSSVVASTALYGKGEDGKPINDLSTNGTIFRSVVATLPTLQVDASAHPNKFPLMNSYIGAYVLDDAYAIPQNYGLNYNNALNNDNPQTFFTIDGKEYWANSEFGLVRTGE